MSREKRTITKTVVDKMMPGELIWDATLPGFSVRCQRRDKVYGLKYRVLGRQRWFTIGKHGAPWTPETARKEAMRLIGDVARNHDPAEAKHRMKTDISVADLCDAYMADAPFIVLPGKGRPKKASSLQTDRSNIERHIKPLLGRRRVRSVTNRDIEELQRAIAAGQTALVEKTRARGKAVVEGGKGVAARAIALLGGIFSYAIHKGLRADNPVKGVILFKNEQRKRHLSDIELKRVGETLQAALKSGTNPYALAAIYVLLFTGCRKSEVIKMEWDWLDLAHGILHLPDSKGGWKDVPLAKPVVKILADLPRRQIAVSSGLAPSPYVFPSLKTDAHLVGLQKIWEAIRIRARIPDVKIHDLRHTFISTAVSSGQSLYIVGKVVGHKQARTTEGYAHLNHEPLMISAEKTAETLQKAIGQIG